MQSTPAADNRFNSYMQFIRPSRPQDPPARSITSNTHNKKASLLHIDTDSLGISYNASETTPGAHSSTSQGNRNEDSYSDIFRRLNFPHDRHRRNERVIASPRCHHLYDFRQTASSVPETPPQFLVDHPPLSPSPSPSSSCSSTAASPICCPVSPPSVAAKVPRRDIPRNKCQIRRSSITSPPSSVSAKSWEHIRSPAASFLASFASPMLPPTEEQDGDEIDDYVLERVIGTGGFSTVRSGYSISDGHKVAVKVIKKTALSEAEQARLDKEIDIWKTLDHPHLVAIEKILETDHAMYIVCTYCSGGSLLDWVNQKGRLSESEARAIIMELCSALKYLHEEARICHKDIKLENILLDDRRHVKLCDFGLAVHVQPCSENSNEMKLDTTKTVISECAGGSLAYAPPEQIASLDCIPHPSTDMWSVGVVLYALVTGKLPFHDEYDLRLQNKILQGRYDTPDGISAQLQQLLHCLLHLNPRHRYTARQVMQSAWCPV
ncbi:kinase-like domain-containing protein [Dichotomocladium elegans]|nr:kinase-like domain-containing protein [Dichotomocladium elegans]